MNNVLIAAALRQLAVAFETPSGTPQEQPPAGNAEAAKPRGRGRPVKGEDSGAAASAVSTAPAATQAATDDPFATPASNPVPTATLDDVRKALTDLKDASSQEKALKVLKDVGGAGNLTDLKPENYGKVVEAANKEVAETTKKDAPPEDDPFALPSSQPEKVVSLEEVKAAVVAAQKTTGTDAVQKVVMEHGGKAKNPDTGVEGPSLKALPVSNYAKVIDAIKALPKTK